MFTLQQLDEIRDNPAKWPQPEIDPPADAELHDMVFDSVVDATDGCSVEPDGICEHGHVSWLLHMGLI